MSLDYVAPTHDLKVTCQYHDDCNKQGGQALHSNQLNASVTRSPAFLGITVAVLGSLIWVSLEYLASTLGASSPQPNFDGIFVTLLLVQTCYYIIAVPRIRRAGRVCLAELDPLLEASDAKLTGLTSCFYDKRLSGLIWAFAAGGLITVLLQEAQFKRFSLWLADPDLALGEMWAVLCALVTWTIGLSSASLLIKHSQAMRRLGRDYIDVDLLRLEQLSAFSRYGLKLAGLVIGLIAVWAVSLVLITSLLGNRWDETSNIVGIIMGFSYICLSITVFVIPQLGIRKRIHDEKCRACIELTRLLPHSTQVIEQADNNPERLAALLSSRAQIQALSEWPAGQHTRLRLTAYLLIPLLSWGAAAFLEEALSRF